MVKTLYLIRHGETEGAHERRYKGSLDVPLSGRGELQAAATGRFMREREMAPEVVFCSPLIRAQRSAEMVGDAFGLAPTVVPGLRERDFGAWEGMSFEEIHAQWPDAFTSWADNPLRFSPVKGESTLEVHDRVVPVIEDLVRTSEAESIAVVAHGGVNRVILCHYSGVPLENIFRMEQGFACLNVIRFYDSPTPGGERSDPLPVLELMNLLPSY